MSRSRRLLAALLALAVLTVALSAGPVSATDAAETPPGEATTDDQFGETADTVAVMLADSRFNGIRLPDELVFAFAWDEQVPHEASLWLQINEALDVWIPVCAGYLVGDDNTVLFLGGSIFGDESDGCVMGVIGDGNDVLFSAIELKGDAILTSAMYVVG